MARPTSSVEDYRRLVRVGRLVGFSVRVEQTDLFIRAAVDLTAQAYDLVVAGRRRILDWAGQQPDFLTSLEPLPLAAAAPPPVKEMLAAGARAGVGPMAAVAGAMAEFVGRGLKPSSPEGIIVENGGDVYLDAAGQVVIGLLAGRSPLSLRLGLLLTPDSMPVGVCTSSATVGHSLSLGRADAATVVADTAALADAAATALGNKVLRPDDIEPALDKTLALPGVRGAVVVMGEKIGLLGDLEIVPLSR
ncbi:MAG: UPF0280 family protein [Thermodesulfobacteriota bacterium]